MFWAGGGECQILVIFGPWRRQVGIWASRGRFWDPTPGESVLLGLQIGVVFGNCWGLFLRYFVGRRPDHVFDDFGMILGSFGESFS